MANERGPGGGPITEIRVHGVGDHEYYTSLGVPTEKRLNDWVQVAEPPPLPAHRLRIVNWSRSHRRTTGFLWYLAFPFTLLNVAGRMEPAAPTGGRPASAALRATVFGVGLVLTVSQLAWLTVLGETLLRYLPVPSAATRVVPVVAALMLAGWMLHRYRTVIRRQEERTDRDHLLPLAHGAVTLIVGAMLAWAAPAQIRWNGWPSTATPPSGESQLDAMALWIAISTVLAFIGALVLGSRYHGAAARPAGAAPVVAAGLLLPVAVLLMHGLTALVRMILDNMLGYVTGLFGQGQRQHLGGILLAYDDPSDAGDSRLDLFPFLVLLAAGAALVAAAVVLAANRSPGLPPLTSGKAARARWWHDFCAAAPRLFPFILPLGVVLAAAAMTTAIALGEGRLGGPWLALAILVLQLAGAAVVLVILLGQLQPVREVLGKIADIAGFWPVRDHPLAGSSYREASVAGIQELIRRHNDHGVVLVAHSQGSVICAWLIVHGQRTSPQRARPYLVTAGSPLGSVYSVFFPATFHPDFLAGVGAGTRAWANYWRRTDPVGSPVDGAVNRLLPDPREDGVVRGHGDYWTEPDIIEYVASLA